MSDRTKPCDVIWQTGTGNHGCQLNEGHGAPHRCCSCSATLSAPVEPSVLSLPERFAKIVDEAESLAAEFECTTPANGAPGYPHCAACCNGTMVQATCTEEFEFAAALDTLVVAGRRYFSMTEAE